MTRNEAIELCKKAYFNPNLFSDDERDAALFGVIREIEKSFPKAKVREFLKLLQKNGVPVDYTCSLWNETR